MFGKGFQRGCDATSANAFLNYGYTVLRAATAGAIVAAGLHPSLSISHQSAGHALRLVDDIMEPFRPTVDLLVRRLLETGTTKMSSNAKLEMVSVLRQDFETAEGVRPLTQVLHRVAVSLAQIYEGKRKQLEIPLSLVPITNEWAGVDN